VTITFEGIRQRSRILPIGMDASEIRISPDGKTLLFTATAARQTNLYTYSLDELAKEPAVARQLTSTPGMKSGAQWSPDSKEVYYLQTGSLQVITVESRQAKPVAITADMDVDFGAEKMEVFAQAWKYLNDNFYDPEFHGADWKAIRAAFEPQIAGARTSDEVRRLVSLMLGELNASHLGISPPGPPTPVTGKLGVRFDPAEYESNGRLRIKEVITLGPADVAGIKAGSYLLAIDGTAIGPDTNLDRLLNYKIDRRVSLTIADNASGERKRELAVRPLTTTAEKQLLYRQWVESRRAYVHKVSNGRLGYVHMPDMSDTALQQLYLDLDTENQARDGVVIDIRNNNGGFVNAYALDVLARRPYLNMTFRDQPAAPARTVLGQRSLERPTILVTNRESLSDAEDFTEGYRTLKLGKVVGEPTAGWIIYTGGTQLIDGSVLRLPSIKITTNEGVNMERHPRPVDIAVDRPLGEWYLGRDTQLDTAVKELLAELR
jgi:C-terminal processing protease CtpA/Prc